MNMTDLRKRALAMLEQRGETEGQDIAEALVDRVFGWRPQGATRWAAGYMAPLIRAGLVSHRSGWRGHGNYYRITDAGRAAVREETDG